MDGGQGMDQNTERHGIPRRLLILRIAVPLLIVAVIAAIYVVRRGAPGEGADIRGLDVAALDMEELKAQELPILLFFSTADCPVCREFRPTVEQFYAETRDRAVVRYLDLTNYPELAANFPIQAVPAQALYLAGGKPYVPGEETPGNFSLYNLRATGEHALTLQVGSLTEAQLDQILEEMEAG